MRKLLIAAASLLAVGMFATTAAQAGCWVSGSVKYCNHNMAAGGPWPTIGCAGSIVVSAFGANWRDGRPLTIAEAQWCGVLYWFTGPNQEFRFVNAKLYSFSPVYLANRTPKKR